MNGLEEMNTATAEQGDAALSSGLSDHGNILSMIYVVYTNALKYVQSTEFHIKAHHNHLL